MCGEKEVTRHEPQTKCQKLLTRIQGLVFTGLAIYTIISLFAALNQVTRKDLQLTTTAPSDRCVPFFDDVNAFVKDHPGTRAVFDFRAGEAITRVCTNESSATVRAALPSAAYDPWSDTGCDVLGTDKSDFLANCVLVNFPTGTNCSDILNITPSPYGFAWNSYATLLTGNDTATGLPYPHCSIAVVKVTGISDCTQPTMEPLHHVDKNIVGLMIVGVIVPFVVMALQAYACYRYSQNWSAENGPLLAFACRGPIGGFYMLWFVCKEGQDGRGEFPDVFLNFWGWIACLIQDGFEGLVIPATALLGCSLTRFPVNVVLIILKAIKILFDFAMYLKNRNETSEPGGDEDQKRLWANLGTDGSQQPQQHPGFDVPRPTDQA